MCHLSAVLPRGIAVFIASSLLTSVYLEPTDRYNPDNVALLEDYLAFQMNEDKYDLLANLAILKL